jgi:peptidoglycan-N-acetylglucosamine deacetylase
MFMTRRSCLLSLAALRVDGQAAFKWPGGKRAAVSLTFDDARLSQVDVGLDVLKASGAKATFYLVPARAKLRLDGWKRAAAEGHEIANHSLLHPCTANYSLAKNVLEDYDEARMGAELDTANAELQALFGVKPKSFAYPCGQTFVGRGVNTRSYIPVVAKRFLTGRGYLNERANDPRVCDLPNLMGTAVDDLDFEQMKKLVDAAAKDGRWIVFVGHEMGRRGFQITDTTALAELCRYVKDPANGVWLDTVEAVAKHVRTVRA